jgi:hypothetical protein
MSRRMENKKRSVCFRGNKTNSLNKRCKTLEPSTRSLFKTIKRFVKKTDMIRSGGVLKTRGLLTIDSFSKMTMKKNIFNIELMKRP